MSFKKPSILLVLFWITVFTAIYAKLTNNVLLNNSVVPFFTLLLLLKYYRNKGDNNIFYFSFFFCFIGDLMVMIDDLYYFISGLMAYWGASILFCFALTRELDRSLFAIIKSNNRIWPFVLYLSYFLCLMVFIQSNLGNLFVPISIYALSLSISCAIGLVTYLEKRTLITLYFAIGLVLLSIAASFIGLNRFYFDHKNLIALETVFYAPSLYYIYLYFNKKINVEN